MTAMIHVKGFRPFGNLAASFLRVMRGLNNIFLSWCFPSYIYIFHKLCAQADTVWIVIDILYFLQAALLLPTPSSNLPAGFRYKFFHTYI